MQNLTRLTKKIYNSWIKSQAPTKKLTKLKKLDKYLILLVCIIFIDGAGPICYAMYLLVQGIAKIAGSAVLALRKPHIPFFSAIGTLIFALVFSSI